MPREITHTHTHTVMMQRTTPVALALFDLREDMKVFVEHVLQLKMRGFHLAPRLEKVDMANMVLQPGI